MKLVGLTGGIGMGKSTAAGFLLQAGVPVVDTDDLARDLVQPGLPAWHEIRQFFGDAVFHPDGTLHRAALAHRVFGDNAERLKLEGILHPKIQAAWAARVQQWREAGMPLGVVVIPLLFETGAESHFDKIICLACSLATQHGRLMARGWSPANISQRLASQWPVDRKMAAAHYVIWTEGELAVLQGQLRMVLDNITGAAGDPIVPTTGDRR